MLTHGILAPHPPVIIPGVGGKDVQKFEKTINALLAVSLKLKENKPDTLIVLTPHAEIKMDSFVVRVPKEPNFTADFTEFGDAESSAEYVRDRLLTAQLIEGIQSAGLRTSILEDAKLDFGSSVPLYYLAAGLPDSEIVNLGVAFAGVPEHGKLGEVIREVADKSEQKIALIASGELSHKVAKSSPHGFDPAGVAWDEKIVQALQAGDADTILQQDPFELDEVGECGFRSIVTLISAFKKIPHKQELLSYEAPGGIGVAVAVFEASA
ncbi:MAG: AmmeMemoRadiSam system protein B [Patescibacteria group bacterium]